MKIRSKNIFFLSCLFLCACQTTVENVDIPAIEQKVVVFGTADNLNDFANINITKSEPLLNNSFNGEFERIKDAIVVLNGPTSSVQFAFANTSETYHNLTSLSFVPGENYELLVNAPGFPEVKANAVMPLPIHNLTWELDSVETQFDIDYTLEIEFDDNPSVDEYYRLTILLEDQFDTFSFYADPFLFTDATAQNGRITIRGSFYGYDGLDKTTVSAIVSSISEDEYRYAKAFDVYDPENPFAEPTPLPNNVSGGLGMFTLKNSVKFPLK